MQVLTLSGLDRLQQTAWSLERLADCVVPPDRGATWRRCDHVRGVRGLAAPGAHSLRVDGSATFRVGEGPPLLGGLVVLAAPVAKGA
jgi:hypothetical protein